MFPRISKQLAVIMEAPTPPRIASCCQKLILFITIHASIANVSAATPLANTSGLDTLFQWKPFLAPFHAVILHYPIGFLTMAALLEVWLIKHPSRDGESISTLTIGLSLCTGLLAAGLGILRASGGG